VTAKNQVKDWRTGGICTSTLNGFVLLRLDKNVGKTAVKILTDVFPGNTFHYEWFGKDFSLAFFLGSWKEPYIAYDGRHIARYNKTGFPPYLCICNSKT
jgi:hypothetical protein